ncbi:MAG: hypothetical protein KDA24_18120 [Deltaproteobacteria bacterium]|nr:hypothetical protein [Deltaproteobacteria bacterium]
MNDFHWWMGLAPLLGFLLDALLGGTRLDDVLESWVRRSVPRVTFLMRNAFGGPTTLAGYGLAAWLAGIALVVAWALSVAGYVLYQEYGVFLIRSLLFLLLFTARRLTATGIEALILISSGEHVQARAVLRRLGPPTDADDADALCGVTVERLAGATLGAVLIPLFWGVLGGSTLGAAALIVHVAAAQRPDDPATDAPMWDALDRVDRWIALPAAWVGALIYPLVVNLVGGRHNSAMAGFLGSPEEPPARRLGRAITKGLNLLPRAEDDRLVATGSHVQKVVQVLFLGGFLCALVMSLASIGLHQLM